MSTRNEVKVNVITAHGLPQKVGTHTVTILVRNQFHHVLLCAGGDAPHDGDAGFATGCIFINSSAGTLFSNRGSETSCNFDAVTV